jgi:hypothetical protein
MGNQVVFSVSYDHLDVLEDQDFGSLASQIHESPYRNCAESPFLQVGDAERSARFG